MQQTRSKIRECSLGAVQTLETLQRVHANLVSRLKDDSLHGDAMKVEAVDHAIEEAMDIPAMTCRHA